MRKLIRNTAVFALMCQSVAGWSAASLTGYVVKDHRHGQPLAGMAIYAQGAGQAISASDGTFRLEFPQLNPGQAVSVRVNLKGWEVVNDELLETRLPENMVSGQIPLIVVACKRGERVQRRLEYFGLVGRERVEQSYKTQLAQLKLKFLWDETQTAKELSRLQKERDQALAQVNAYAYQAANAKVEESSGLYGEAFRLFIKGEADKALQLLSDKELAKESQLLQKQLLQNARSWQLKAQILVTKFDFDGAARAHEEAINAAPTSFDTWLSFARFNDDINRLTAARHGYEMALRLAREAGDNENKARA